jgi:hypothetical protein
MLGILAITLGSAMLLTLPAWRAALLPWRDLAAVSARVEQLSSPPVNEAMTLPLDSQVVYLFIAVGYEQDNQPSFRTRGYRIGIVYAPESEYSVKTRLELTQLLGSKPRHENKPVTVFELAFSGPDQLRDAMQSNQINILYVCPGNARNLQAIVDVSRQLRVMTLSGLDQYAQAGIALSLEGIQRGNQLKPAYSVNTHKRNVKFESEFTASALKTYTR